MIRHAFERVYDFIAWAVTGHDPAGKLPDKAYGGGDPGPGSTIGE